jgi:predicted GTPase
VDLDEHLQVLITGASGAGKSFVAYPVLFDAWSVASTQNQERVATCRILEDHYGVRSARSPKF